MWNHMNSLANIQVIRKFLTLYSKEHLFISFESTSIASRPWHLFISFLISFIVKFVADMLPLASVPRNHSLLPQWGRQEWQLQTWQGQRRQSKDFNRKARNAFAAISCNFMQIWGGCMMMSYDSLYDALMLKSDAKLLVTKYDRAFCSILMFTLN